MGLLTRFALALTGSRRRALTDNLRPGSIVAFGSYPQDSGGTRKALEWRVLASHGDRMLLITEHAVAEKPYHHDMRSNASWEKSDLKQWLNREFFEEAFTDSEKKLILNASSVSSADTLPKAAAASDNLPEGESPLGSGDRVFILSEAETRRYFKNEADACCSTFFEAHEPESSQSGEGSGWWLRSPGIIAGCAAYVDKKGCINKHGANVFLPGTYVRPAIWIEPDESLTALKTAALRSENAAGWKDLKVEEYRKSLAVRPFFKFEGIRSMGAIRSDEEMAMVDKTTAEKSRRRSSLIL